MGTVTQQIIKLQEVISYLLNDCVSIDAIKGDAELLVAKSKAHIDIIRKFQEEVKSALIFDKYPSVEHEQTSPSELVSAEENINENVESYCSVNEGLDNLLQISVVKAKGENLEESNENTTIIRCLFCEKDFYSGQAVREHDKDLHVKNGKFICQECPFESDDKKSVVHHFVAEHKRIPFFNCVKCNHMFFTPKELRNHMKEQHEMFLEKEDCPICFVKLSKDDNRTMLLHMDHEHSNVRFQCDTCQTIYKDRICLKMHNKSQHSGSDQKRTCAVCGKSIHLQYFENHLARHYNSERTIPCPNCEKMFVTKMDLSRHMAVHGGKDNSCNDCGFKTRTLSTLKRHIILKHTEDRPFECVQCKLKFKLEDGLKKHQFLHTGIRQYVCSVCGKEFKKPSHLKTHMKIHDKVYQAHCELCNKQFVQKYNYVLHMRNHHSEMNK